MDRFEEGWDGARGKRYIEKTKDRLPKSALVRLVKEIEPGKAIELGIGSGTDTIHLLKSGWNVDAVDINEEGRNRVQKAIESEQEDKFVFIKRKFEDLKLQKNQYDLVVGFDSLHFCDKEFFQEFFNTISGALKTNGYFIGNLLGDKDSWKKIKNNSMVFFSREEIVNLFKEYEIVFLKENESDGQTISGKPKHWHSFLIKARKK